MSNTTDRDGDVDGDDVWFYRAYDERWREIANFREDDTDPKEEFVPHQAGPDGLGWSSYINGVVLRDKDADTAWTEASDGTLEERVYYCQNWRGDVSALVTSGRQMLEWVKYLSYGVPFGLPAGDTDSDGDCDNTDIAQIQSWANSQTYDVRGDIDLDGDVDATDVSLAQSSVLGFDSLSLEGHRAGFAGMAYADATGLALARQRWQSPGLGRWLRRDPLGYVDGANLYQYGGSRAVRDVDPTGLLPCPSFWSGNVCGDGAFSGSFDPTEALDKACAEALESQQKSVDEAFSQLTCDPPCGQIGYIGANQCTTAIAKVIPPLVAAPYFIGYCRCCVRISFGCVKKFPL